MFYIMLRPKMLAGSPCSSKAQAMACVGSSCHLSLWQWERHEPCHAINNSAMTHSSASAMAIAAQYQEMLQAYMSGMLPERWSMREMQHEGCQNFKECVECSIKGARTLKNAWNAAWRMPENLKECVQCSMKGARTLKNAWNAAWRVPEP